MVVCFFLSLYLILYFNYFLSPYDKKTIVGHNVYNSLFF